MFRCASLITHEQKPTILRIAMKNFELNHVIRNIWHLANFQSSVNGHLNRITSPNHLRFHSKISPTLKIRKNMLNVNNSLSHAIRKVIHGNIYTRAPLTVYYCTWFDRNVFIKISSVIQLCLPKKKLSHFKCLIVCGCSDQCFLQIGIEIVRLKPLLFSLNLVKLCDW